MWSGVLQPSPQGRPLPDHLRPRTKQVTSQYQGLAKGVHYRREICGRKGQGEGSQVWRRRVGHIHGAGDDVQRRGKLHRPRYLNTHADICILSSLPEPSIKSSCPKSSRTASSAR